MTYVTGIALDGVPIYTGSSLTWNGDPFYPTNWEDLDPTPEMLQVDTCLGRTEPDGVYHYRAASPCVLTHGPGQGSDCTNCY